MVKAKKTIINDTISIKISFMMVEIKLTIIMLPVVFKEFKVGYIFLLLLFLFTALINW